MSVPISATRTSAVRLATPGMLLASATLRLDRFAEALDLPIDEVQGA